MGHNAKSGGEYGANGEFYRGGQFVNTVAENAKRDAAARKYRSRRQLIAPGEFALPPSDTTRSIFARLQGVYRFDHATGTLGDAPAAWREYVGVEYATETDGLRDRYNAGERWVG
jgi:hypothetical protein